jgi:hypothetical protein
MRQMQVITEQAVQQAQQASFMVCALLAQCGGSKTVTQGTLDQCMAAHDKMGFAMRETVPGKEFEVTLLFKDEEEVPTQADDVAPIQAVAAPTLQIAPLIITG